METIEKQWVSSFNFSNKEEYIWDIYNNIGNCFSGRIDGGLANTFIQEASQLLINSIVLFEKGYFDCAYYSLRQSIEITTTFVYLYDLDEKKSKEMFLNWKNNKKFPMQSQMLNELKQTEKIFKEMLDNMPDFFDYVKEILKVLNKPVHKQGFDYFYVALNHPILSKYRKNKEEFIRDFKFYLDKCIGIVAIMRLAIDPYPLLLMDENLLLREYDSMTEAYSEKFVNKYIDNKYINEYKQTAIYQYHENHILNKPKRSIPTFNVMKHNIISIDDIKTIIEELHLLDIEDAIAVLMANFSEKAVKVYALGGWKMYFTSRNTNRTKMSWSSRDFDDFSKNNKKMNQIYDEVFISVYTINSKDYYIEHNEKMTALEYRKLKESVEKYLKSSNRI